MIDTTAAAHINSHYDEPYTRHSFSSESHISCGVYSQFETSLSAQKGTVARMRAFRNKAATTAHPTSDIAATAQTTLVILGGRGLYSYIAPRKADMGKIGRARGLPQNSVSAKPMPVAAKKTTPAYRQIQNAILQRIESGELKSGDAVASERELARIHGVSLMTARHALAVLEREGMVERRRGAGTFVAPPRVHFNKLMSYTEQMAGRSLPVRSRILSMSTVSDAPEIAARLLLPPGTRLLRLERLRRAGDEPFAIETCYLSAAEFPLLTREKLERASLFAALEVEYRLKISYADEEVDATPADPQVARRLGVPHGFPLLRLRQVIHAGSGKPFLYVLGLYRADRHTLHVRRFR